MAQQKCSVCGKMFPRSMIGIDDRCPECLYGPEPDIQYKELVADRLNPAQPTCPHCMVNLKLNKKKNKATCPHCGFVAERGYWEE